MKTNSIKFKILISFSLLIIAITTLIAIATVTSGGKLIADSTQDSVITLAEDNAMLVESRMETLLKELSTLALQEEIASMDLEQQISTLKEELASTSFLDLAIVQQNGTATYTDGSEADLADREYITKALAGQANISDVIISKVTGQPVIMVAAPIKEGDTVVGVLIGRRDGNTLSEIATDAGHGKNGYAYMINRDGTIIAHANSELVNNKLNPIAEATKDSSYKSLAAAMQTIISQDSGFVKYHYAGKSIYAGFTKVNNSDWTIVVTAIESEAIATIDELKNKITIISITILIITLIITYFMGEAITRPIKAVTKLSEKIANLDISENVPPKYLKWKDENGVLANAMQNIMDNLRKIVSEITDSSMQVSSTAQELAATSEQAALAAEEVSKTVEEIAKGASEQAGNTEIGSSQAIMLGSLIEKNREYMYNMNKTSDKVTEVVKGGLNDISHLTEISEENNQATKEIYDIILKTNESTSHIGEASNVIAAIADQTNLLALNASIEAARAGEAGKGFAVVASEIKKLAGQSAASTNYINQVVLELQTVVTKAVESIERVNEISKEQFESVTNTKVKYESVMTAMEETVVVLNQLNESEDGMMKSKNDILDMLQTLSAIAEENAASTEEASSAMLEQSTSMEEIAKSSERLEGLVIGLQDIIMRFKA